MTKRDIGEFIGERFSEIFYLGILLFIFILSVFTFSTLEENLGNDRYVDSENKTRIISPTGVESEGSGNYRFTEYQDGIMYGPYFLNGSKYYVYDEEVFDNEGNQRQKPKIEGLHNLYLKTYFDPLFYAASNQKPVEGNYERFEKEKILSKYCGLEYDLVPTDFFDSLNENHEVTEDFLQSASYSNAERLLESNLNTTESYSDFVLEFLELTQKNISSNDCFKDEVSSRIAQATRTPTQYRIDDEVLMSHVKLANENSKVLLQTIEERRKILHGQKKVELKSEEPTLMRKSDDYERPISPFEAKEEMNQRRLAETKEVLNLQEENKETIDDSSHSNGEDTHTHYSEEKDDGDKESHSHEEEEHTHSKDESKEEQENGDENSHSSNQEKRSENISLTEEEERYADLVEEKPVQYDTKTFCMERNSTSIYGWDKNIYPNVIRGQRVLLQEKEAQIKDFFTVSRCPYVEITRLKWYNLDRQYGNIDSQSLSKNYRGAAREKFRKAEEIFLENPGDETLRQLSKGYTYSLMKSLRNGKIPKETPKIWRRSVQAKSKLNVFEETYDDFYNEDHMKVWDSYFPEPKSNETRSVYNNFLLLESLYALNFFTWSESIWRLEDEPKRFNGIITRRE